MVQKFADFIFNRPGWQLAFVALGLLIMSAVWTWTIEQRSQFEKYTILENPQEYAGTHVCMPYGKVVLIHADTALTVNSREAKYRFVVDTTVVHLYQTYSFAGVLQGDGTIVVSDVHHHSYRFGKYALSLLSLPIMIWLIVKYIRFDQSTLSLIVIPERRDA